MKPEVFRQRNGLQLSYKVPSTIYDSHIYPRQSSNGSTVIVYGHESGVRVVWYAGKKFKPQTDPPPPAKLNGSVKEDAIVIDLDGDNDEPAQSEPAPAKVEFEKEEDEIDPSHPYHDVLRFIDISLGTAAVRLAVPHLPGDLSDSATHPGLLNDHAMIAVGCADIGLRLIVLPLQPPAPGLSDLSGTGVQILRLSGPGFHQDLLSSLALTYTGETDDRAEDTGHGQQWSLLVASTSCTGSGLLLVHQIPIKLNRLSTDSEYMIPIRRQHLRSPLMSASLSFNTSLYPAERHATLLITLPDAPCVKVYQVFWQPAFNRSRRGSVGTTDSASSTRSTHSTGTNNGKFLITLLPEIAASNSIESDQCRKRVLDAKWILGGKAIIVLLQDGEWGVWDLEAAGPVSSTSNQNLIKGQGNVAGIVGGSWTRFAIKGTQPSAIDASVIKQNPVSSSSGLVTATPHTRKAEAEGLFHGVVQPTRVSSSIRLGAISTAPSRGIHGDESVVITYGTQSFYIPSILSYWKSEAMSRGALSALSGNSSILPPLRTGGEAVKNVSCLPQIPEQRIVLFGARAHPSLMAFTSSRLILFVTPLQDGVVEEGRPRDLARPLPLNLENTDQSLLQQGALDVDGMDRILEGMESPSHSRLFPASKSLSKARPNFGRSVGFAQDIDMDLTPDMPSPRTTSKLQLSRNKGTERRLFS